MYSEYYAGQYQGSEGHAMPVAHDPSKCTVHVGNVESHFTENDLLSYFQHYGPVARVKMAGDASYPARFAFVEYMSPESAAAALQSDRTVFGSRAIRVSMSKASSSASTSTNSTPGSINSVGGLGQGRGVVQQHSFQQPYGGARYTDPRAISNYAAASPAPGPVYAAMSSFKPIPLQPSLEEESLKELVSRTVYVSGVDHNVSEDDVSSFFAMAGRVTNCSIRGDTEHPSKFAFVEFGDLVGAHNAMQCSGYQLGDGIIKVSRSKNAISHGKVKNLAMNRVMPPEEKKRIEKTVYVGQLAHALTKEEVRVFFQSCGDIAKVAMAGSTDPHKTRFAFVEFEKLEGAKSALALNETTFGGNIIKVKPSKTPIYDADEDSAASKKRSREEDDEDAENSDKRRRREDTGEKAEGDDSMVIFSE